LVTLVICIVSNLSRDFSFDDDHYGFAKYRQQATEAIKNLIKEKASGQINVRLVVCLPVVHHTLL
jgi:hypothetical protein